MSENSTPSEDVRPELHGILTRRQRLAAIGLAALGLLLAGAGVAAVFRTQNGTGAAALLAVGAAFLLFAALGDRLESMRVGDVEVVLRRKAIEAAGRGDLETARVLQRAADAFGQRVEMAARTYKTVRGNMPSGPDRTKRMQGIVVEARKDAHAPDLDVERVLSLLWTGSEGARVWALGILQERPELATTRAVLEAVQRPDQMFDQFQALVLAERYVSMPSSRPWARERIADEVRDRLTSGAFGDDSSCIQRAKRVLALVPTDT